MKIAVWVAAVAVGITVALPALPVLGQSDDPAQPVFMLEIVRHEGDRYTGIGYGTAFFVSEDGTALTNSHVAYNALRDPDQYELLAVVDKEFYSVEVVCACKLPYDPLQRTPVGGVALSRDVAKIKLVPATFPFDEWSLRLKTGERLLLASAHRGALPRFPFFADTGRPGVWNHVSVIGFGHISPLPEKWRASGMISAMNRAPDGTEVFDVEFSNPAQPGNSGSPVLNERQQVVGMWTWQTMNRQNLGTAISSSALQHPCR